MSADVRRCLPTTEHIKEGIRAHFPLKNASLFTNTFHEHTKVDDAPWPFLALVCILRIRRICRIRL